MADSLYGHKWRKAREQFLREHPLCRMHEQRGMVVASTVVDHIEPHRGDRKLFWRRSNWQPLCKSCHDSHKQAEEKGGGIRAGSDASGLPLDQRHHWHRGDGDPGGR